MFRLFSILCFWLKGWKIDHELIPKKGYKKFILVGAPHTSNWDVVYFLGALHRMNLKPNFLIKKMWMKFPFGLMFKPLGGIAIDRSPKEDKDRKSTVTIMVELFNSKKELIIAISPEGTRSLNTQWKKGFYHTAVEAKVPILLGYLDYKTRTAGISKAINPSGNVDQDFAEIGEFYEKIVGKYPSQFSANIP